MMTREEALAELSVLHERLSNPKDCEDGCYSWEDGWYVEAIDMAIEALTNVQNMHIGEWIVDDGDTTCSRCQRLFKGSKYDRMYNEKFCPNCGSRMIPMEPYKGGDEK